MDGKEIQDSKQKIDNQQIQKLNYKSKTASSFSREKIVFVLTILLFFIIGAVVVFYIGSVKQLNPTTISQPTPMPTSFKSIYPTSFPTISIRNEKTIEIKDSGSTNFPQAKLTVNMDGSGRIIYTGSGFKLQHVSSTTKDFPKGTFSALIAIMSKISNISQIPTGLCGKSSSFGSTTTIEYNGYTSSDLQCLAPNASQTDKDLANEVQKDLNFAQ